MKIYSALIDKKIMGINASAEMPLAEYLSFADKIIDNNDLQRSPVRSEGKPYELLRRDLIEGCVIPPIILAVSDAGDAQLRENIRHIIESGDANERLGEIESEISAAIADHRILILDGLQRTLTLKSALSDLSPPEKAKEMQTLLSRVLRFEVYLGLSKQGILYRMLTLNTGQTPMSFRHQLEILYHDYLDGKNLPKGIEVYREVDAKRARGLAKYKFSDVVELFYSFSTGSPLPYDKQSLVGTLKEMSFLEDYRYDPAGDSMNELLACYNEFVCHVERMSNDWTFNSERTQVSRPFGNTVPSIFSKTQPMAAFGAECKSLIDKKVYPSLTAISDEARKLSFRGDPHVALDQLIVVLDQIGSRAKKIGDAQRYYFQLAFRELLLPSADEHGNLSGAWTNAQEKYEMLYT